MFSPARLREPFLLNSLLAGGGCDIITLQNIRGHKNLAMAQRYAHLILGKQEKTRESMQNFWQSDTIGDTEKKEGKKLCLNC